MEQQERRYGAPNPLYNTLIRHGFGIISEKWMSYLAEGFLSYFADKRHETGGTRRIQAEKDQQVGAGNWRVTDRQRTVNAALVLCLNLGVDPPDVVKTVPSAKVEAGVNPSQLGDYKKALEQIGKNLQAQYETLSTRTKYKQSLDPNVDDAKRFCMGLRRSARDDRILFHYNGHGVPRPTPSGEFWVFNRGYTQYIPVPIYELQSWLGAPVIYCWDCSGAGHIVRNFNDFVEKRKRDEFRQGGPAPGDIPASAYDSCIQMGSCQADEILPMNPALPADLFTCCITTPVDIAVKWFLLQNQGTVLGTGTTSVQIPGKVTDRRTPLGELIWIFTAITDTIAWSALDQPLFKRLFRQDLVVAAMFRNFLLACRIMRAHNCHPVSSPALPDTHEHPLWDAWDLALNHCLLQITAGVPAEKYEFSDFFEQQLTAFEVWLTYRSADVTKPPEQLPVLLQVLLSQIHRLRALLLLSRYLDLGPPAVRIALSIGFFIYVLKLLQSPAPELKPVLVFIWARIMAVDYRDIQHELVKENGYSYFVQILVSTDQGEGQDDLSKGGYAEHLAMCCFVLAQFSRGFPQGQALLASNRALLESLGTRHTREPDSPLLRQWAVLLAGILAGSRECSLEAAQSLVSPLLDCLRDPIPEVRAAALLTLSNIQGTNKQADDVAKATLTAALDASPLVRSEYVVLASHYVVRCESQFLVCAFTTLEEEFAASQHGGDPRSDSPAHGTTALATWRCLLVLTTDAADNVRLKAEDVVDRVHLTLLRTPLGDDVRRMVSLLNPRGVGRAARAGGRVLNSTGSSISDASPASVALHHQTEQAEQHDTGIRAMFKWVAPARKSTNGNGSLQTPPAETDESASAHSKMPWTVGTAPESPSRPAVIPLESQFYDWCVEYFTEPQLRSVEADEPGSQRYLARIWRKEHNERIMAETQVQKELAVTGSWATSLGSLKAPYTGAQPPSSLLFAQFEPHLIALSGAEVFVYDWSRQRSINTFRAATGPHVAACRLINEDDSPLLLTASGDGTARVFRRYAEQGATELLTAWWLMADLPRASTGPGKVVMDWQQSRGALLVGGDTRVVRVWDAAREAAVDDIPVRTASQLVSLTSDQVMGNIVIGGLSDGAVHVWDRRLPRSQSLIRRWRGHHDQGVVGVRMQRGGPRELVSGSADGLINLWDVRANKPVGQWQAHTRDMRCMDLHEHAPVIATASRVVGVWSTAGRRVSTLKAPASSYLSSKAPPVGAMTFHPHQMMLAINNATDATISMFQCT